MKTAKHELDWLKLEFQNIGIEGLGIPPSDEPGCLYVSLHTANPEIGTSQSTYEAAYKGYARVAVARSKQGWVVTGGPPARAANADEILFPLSEGGRERITHYGLGDANGTLRRYGTWHEPMDIKSGVKPYCPAGALVFREN